MWNLAVYRAAQQQWPDHRRAAFELAQIYMTATAAAGALVNRVQNRKTGMQPANVIIPRVGNRSGRVAFRAGHRHQTAVPLPAHAHAGPVAAGAVVTITGHADINNSWIELFNCCKIELEPAHDAGAE